MKIKSVIYTTPKLVVDDNTGRRFTFWIEKADGKFYVRDGGEGAPPWAQLLADAYNSDDRIVSSGIVQQNYYNFDPIKFRRKR